jgi:hypothetical protein
MVDYAKKLLVLSAIAFVIVVAPVWYSVIGIAAACFTSAIDKDEIDIAENWKTFVFWPAIIPAVVGRVYRREIRELLSRSA